MLPSESVDVDVKVTDVPVGAGSADAVNEAAGATFAATLQPAAELRSPQPSSVPVSFCATSATRRVQVPPSGLPANAASRPPAGLKVPVYGAVPAESGVDAESLKTVLTKLSPLLSTPPGRSASITLVPSGPVSSICRSPSQVWVRWEIATSTFDTVPPPATVTAELTRVALLSGIGFGSPAAEVDCSVPGLPVVTVTGTR